MSDEKKTEAEALASSYPPNSHKKRTEIEEGATKRSGSKGLEKIVTGEITERRRSLGSRIAESFAGDDMRSVGLYILQDVFIPAIKNMLSDAASQGVERMLFGERSGRSTSSMSSRDRHVSYNKMYSSNKDDRRTVSRQARASHDFKEVIFANRGEAEYVLDTLGEIIDTYDQATVSDFYDLVGITGSYTDDKWGWDSISGSRVERTRGGGFVISLPRTKPID